MWKSAITTQFSGGASHFALMNCPASYSKAPFIACACSRPGPRRRHSLLDWQSRRDQSTHRSIRTQRYSPRCPKPVARHAAFPAAEIGSQAANSPSDSIPTSKLAARAFTSPPEIPSSTKTGPGLVLPTSTSLISCKRPASTAASTANTQSAKTAKKEPPPTYPAMWAGAIWG